MGELFTIEFILLLLNSTVLAGTTLIWASVGEVVAERSGILNLGVEGMMLFGAVTGYMSAYYTGNPYYAILVAALGGAVLSLLHAFVCITLRADQIVSGLALTIFGMGFSAFIGRPMVGQTLPETLTRLPIPGLVDIPYVGFVLFNHNILVYAGYLLVPLVWFWLFRTRWGLHGRAVGESPEAAAASGISVPFYRYLHTLFGGACAGVAGAHLAVAVSPSWVEGMTAGRGWIAIALVVFASWEPIRAMLGAFLFGGIEALVFRLQAVGVPVSAFLLMMLPYVLTILVLVYASYRRKQLNIQPPAALAQIYESDIN